MSAVAPPAGPAADSLEEKAALMADPPGGASALRTVDADGHPIKPDLGEWLKRYRCERKQGFGGGAAHAAHA